MLDPVNVSFVQKFMNKKFVNNLFLRLKDINMFQYDIKILN